MQRSNSQHTNSGGFTLIELLVVIAIIAILAAILFPVFAQAKRAAKDTAALSNVKQTATSLNLYGSDFEDAVVLFETNDPWYAWTVLIQPYAKNTNILFDPSRVNNVKIGPQPWTSSPNIDWGWQTHMAINRYGFSSLTNWHQRTLTSLENANQRLAFAYSEVKYSGLQYSQHWFDGQRSACPAIGVTATDYGAGQYNPVSDAAIDLHGNGLIGAFADSHAVKSNYKRWTRATKSYDDSSACEGTLFYGPDGYNNSSDDPDNELTKFWGRWWSESY